MEANGLINIYSGERKYLNREERQAFKIAVKDMEPKIQTFCLMIYYTWLPSK